MIQEVKIEKNIPLPEEYKTKEKPIEKYKWMCIRAMSELKVGESIKIKDRSLYTIEDLWLWIVRGLSLGGKFAIKSIDKKTHRVWRIK